MNTKSIYQRYLQQRRAKAEQHLRAIEYSPPGKDINGWPWLSNDFEIESIDAGDARRPIIEQQLAEPAPLVIPDSVDVAGCDTDPPPMTHEDWIKAGCMEHQPVAMNKLVELIGKQGRCAQVIEITGSGKTIVACLLINYLRKHYPHRFPEHQPILWFTPIERQTTMRVGQWKCKSVMVFSIKTINAQLGKLWLRWETRVINGSPTPWPVWTFPEGLKPCLIIVDEHQKLKNENSAISKTFRSLAEFNYSGWNMPVLLMSAGPYSRPNHVRTTACLLMPRVDVGHLKNQILTDKLFPSWIAQMAAPRNPADWCPTAMKRIQEVLEPYTVRMAPIAFKCKSVIRQVRMKFSSYEKAKIYAEAFDEYQAKRIAQEKNPLVGFAAVLVALAKFLQVAEILRADEYAKIAAHKIKEGFNVIIVCKFRDTFAVVKDHLIQLGVDENLIAEIYGGQNINERFKNQMRFQTDKAHICLLMFGAGNLGLDLDQFDEINTRQRIMLMPAAWNDLDIMQVVGRPLRVRSTSNALIFLLVYEGTEEIKQLGRVRYKLRALKEVTKGDHAWQKIASSQAEDTRALGMGETKQLRNGEEDDEGDEEQCEEVTQSTRHAGGMVEIEDEDE